MKRTLEWCLANWGKITGAILSTAAVVTLVYRLFDGRVQEHIARANEPIIDLQVLTITRMNAMECAIKEVDILDCDTYKGVPDEYNPSVSSRR